MCKCCFVAYAHVSSALSVDCAGIPATLRPVQTSEIAIGPVYFNVSEKVKAKSVFVYKFYLVEISRDAQWIRLLGKLPAELSFLKYDAECTSNYILLSLLL